MNDMAPKSILMADDDPDDRLLIQEAFQEAGLSTALYFVEDGEELMDFLRHEGKHSQAERPLPGLILLDLNMPRKDGREALREIRADQALRRIPIVVLTTSKSEEDICRSYDMGANSYITKPVSFESLVRMVELLGKYWLETVELPPY
jgi:CheY-like chemotaxis protein